jgi:hypothetical protein
MVGLRRLESEAHLVGFVRSGGSGLALLARRELGEVAVVVALPARHIISKSHCATPSGSMNAHLVVEDLALARLGLGDEAVIEHIEDILAHVLQLGLDLLAVVADDADVLLGALGLLFLLDT